MSQLTEMIPQVAPEYHALLVKTAAAIDDDPYRAEILGEMDAIVKKAEAKLYLTKTAGPKVMRNWKEIAKGTGAAFGVMTAGGIAMALAGDLYESAKRGLTRGRDYKNMLKANPDLARASNAVKAKAHFSTLHRFNPEFAKDPNIAGTFVRNAIDVPGSELASAKDLVKARADMQKPRELPGMGSAPGSIVYNG